MLLFVESVGRSCECGVTVKQRRCGGSGP